MKIKGAIFDFDGTLIDSLGFWKVFYRKVGEHFFGDPAFAVDAADDRAMRTQNTEFLGRTLHNNYGAGKSAEEVRDWFYDRFGWYYDNVVPLKPGVRELLAYWKEQGVKMCVATASEIHMVKKILERHGVMDYFEDVISCTKVGAGKDKPDVFLAAAEFLGTPLDQTWVVEDSMLAIETAKKAGFPTVGVYDANAFGQDRAKELSDVYVEESFEELIP